MIETRNSEHTIDGIIKILISYLYPAKYISQYHIVEEMVEKFTSFKTEYFKKMAKKNKQKKNVR